MPIGPQLPPHLQRHVDSPATDDDSGNAVEQDQDQDFGPSLPPHLAKMRQQKMQAEVGPSLPSGSSRSRSERSPSRKSGRSPSRSDQIGPSRAVGPQAPPRQAGPQLPRAAGSRSPTRTVGPSRPEPVGSSRAPGPARGPVGPIGPPRPGQGDESVNPTVRPARTPVLPENDDSSDDEVGPKLSDFVDASAAPEKSAAELFREREARMAAAPKPEEKKVTQRDEWMLAPPTGGSLASLDPRKRPTTFQKSAKADTDLDGQREWTETPAEREKRLREGGSSRSRPEDLDRKRARERDDAIRQGVQQHATSRGPSLMEQHKAKKSKTDEPEVIWDRDSMLGVGGMLSEEQREKKIKEARNLGDRFGHGKSGAYL
ncbi:hypothetical protein A1Q1_04336 [Trichosporon asahii var. asahii CBS 2479]|uniref:DUF3752 domain-containing protein n=1 Tax=Trichosporon asahii var. asahii (strain ATCC 90039 / CBS 2479 / JCM 2466 / KCTC 7840 / NBRC 103889/ NCYC 2677 / UAMH 7654) TaxID=1186058 RepID=J6F5V5_TRIAS|nr:hypothetical protein A1Q1_04336 [Trichosporon asahii var. asahii CBS 2479]EJT52429.1 hypothetical protein A1Q1_04336 [Trichosporon asahii var. asahii CBS 2479]